MQKRVLILSILALLVLTILSINLVSADRVDDAYICLNGLVNRTTSLPLQESVFSVLALGELESPVRSIENQEYPSLHCWPRSGCKIKESG